MSRIKINTSRMLNKFTTLMLVISLACSLCACNRDDNDFDGTRFGKTRRISVSVETLKTSGVSCDSSEIAQYIHDTVLRECNIDVKFMDASDTKLHFGENTDISISSNYNKITTYYRMNSVHNIAPMVYEYSDSLTNLTGLLGEDNFFYCTDNTSEVWYLAPRNYEPDARVTFIRADWLEKLNLEVPTTRDEFHNCLVAFRDNADLLLGSESASMVPFFIDNDPSVSAKPLFDSMYDPEISAKDFYVNGYNRVTQDGYKDGLKILNDWYLEGLLPSDFTTIRPLTKESYEPIENGLVGAFCAKYDYLYANGQNAHINAFKANCGNDAEYIAINTFENSKGEYTYWQEDYLNEESKMIFIPSMCEEPLACLVYLNWISDPANIEAIQNISLNNTNPDDTFTYDRYLITCDGLYPNGGLADNEAADQARSVAQEVKFVHQNNKCVRYGPELFQYTQNDIDYDVVYPDSTKMFADNCIIASAGTFDSVYAKEYEQFYKLGTSIIYKSRNAQWDQVVDAGDITVW